MHDVKILKILPHSHIHENPPVSRNTGFSIQHSPYHFSASAPLFATPVGHRHFSFYSSERSENPESSSAIISYSTRPRLARMQSGPSSPHNLLPSPRTMNDPKRAPPLHPTTHGLKDVFGIPRAARHRPSRIRSSKSTGVAQVQEPGETLISFPPTSAQSLAFAESPVRRGRVAALSSTTSFPRRDLPSTSIGTVATLASAEVGDADRCRGFVTR
jgi:hypothetical protein